MYTYTMTNEDLEETADVVKVTVLDALVKEGFIKYEEADTWCASHGVKVIKKNIWRTLSDKWRKETECEGILYQMVTSNAYKTKESQNA